MRRHNLIGLLLALTAATCSWQAGADTASAWRQVNLRAQPDLNARIVGVLDKGGEVRILALVPGSEFVQIERLADGLQGYLRLLNLEQVRAATPVQAAPTGALIYRARLRINLRASRDPASRIVAILQPDADVRLIGTAGEYAHVERLADGVRGHLKLKYLQAVAPPDIPDPADYL